MANEEQLISDNTEDRRKFRDSGNGMVFTEAMTAGRGFDLQGQAMKRLGDPFTKEFQSSNTSGTIRAIAEKYKDQLTEEEYEELISYAGLIGLLFGFQDEEGAETVEEVVTK